MPVAGGQVMWHVVKTGWTHHRERVDASAMDELRVAFPVDSPWRLTVSCGVDDAVDRIGESVTVRSYSFVSSITSRISVDESSV